MVGISTASLESQDGRPCGTGTSQASTWKVWDDQFFVSCLEPWFMMLEVTGDVSTHWIRQNTKLCALSVASFTQHLHQKPSTWFKCWVWPLFPTWTMSFPHVKLSRGWYYFPSGVQVAGEGRGAWDGSPLPWPCQKTNGACEKTGDTCFRRVSSFASKITCIENLDCGYYLIWHFFAGKPN